MRRPVSAVASVLALMLTLSACSGGTLPPPGSGSRGAAPARSSEDGLVVEVRNDNQGDYEIYLVRDGRSTRLGVVTRLGSEVFEVDRAQFTGQGQVGLEARSLSGSARFRSPPVLVGPGERLMLSLAPDLNSSRVFVRR